MKDEEILALIKGKKQEGLSLLLDKYLGLITYVVRNTGIFNEEDLSECISDILYTVWNRINKYNSAKASFKTWLMLVTRGCALDYLRKSIRKGKVVSFDEIEEIAVSDSAFEKAGDRSVLSFLQELEPPDNEIFYRRFVLGESVNAISKLLSISQDSVYKRISRGREKLKSILNREGYQYA